jgi:hypothetical protein
MEILYANGCPYKDPGQELAILRCRLAAGETLRLGGSLSIDLLDASTVTCSILLLEPGHIEDFAPVSRSIREKAAAEGRQPDAPKQTVTGPGTFSVVIGGVNCNSIITPESLARQAADREHSCRVCLTPYRELRLGDLSIHDHTRSGYAVPARVIAYLKAGAPYLMSPGIYEHPFESGRQLPGPYALTDGHFWWDQDTWQYVTQYHLTLPQAFIDHVMSPEGKRQLIALTGQRSGSQHP